LTVISYFPSKREDMIALEKKAAKLHAETVGQYVMSLDMPKEQKLRLIQAVRNIASASLCTGASG